ncbi:DUF1302 domain-containing protein [Pseudomonas sp. PDM15]|uniref:DUF1302 domain-containing protein n=1 Tax=Pseudomonas sp. PDM15 TaxID=2769303 RepID=UPI001786F47B|nr:DUF1302 domain-containing protein [Pseudomonas sp. PDM15]MBD9424016.1 DUF1302 domain-containing protein [Pseudomonas sp. PDM15]
MTTTTRRASFRPHTLAAAIALGLSGGAQAVSFNIGEIEGQLDSSLSVGASWSMRGADRDLIGANNGGDGLAQTTDDSRQNFKKGETFSKIFKGIHDLELKYGDTGVFVRGKYWYDFELKDEQRLFKDIDDSNRKEGAQSSGAQLLDAFVYHNYSIADEPGSVRLGKQVVSWGESTFIQNSINSINPVDVSAFRRPGAELKEGLIPVNMFYVSQSLTENLSAEAFYQLEWDQTVVDNCGTYFAQVDIIADGCDENLRVLAPNSVIAAGLPLLSAFNVDANEEGVLVRRAGDRDARDDGQWGAALRYFFEPLDTEFGAYFMNYHSRAPFFSIAAADQATYDAVGAVPVPGLRAVAAAASASYFLEYPEDIRLYGLSFSTTLPTGTAWQGEVSYRPNAPVQLNTTDILYSGLTPLAGFSNVSVLQGVPGQDTTGYRRKEITQFQTTFTHFFDQVMGAERFTLVGEIGVAHVGGLEKTSEARYGRDPIFGPGELSGDRPNTAGPLFGAGMSSACEALNKGTLNNGAAAGASPENVSKYCEDDGFGTSTSWGYRMRAIWDYNDVIAGINLKPSIAWSHDVDGYGPNGLFTEGSKAVSLGLDAEYQNTYTASLSYTDFFGGDYNTSIDRDFLAFSVGMSF